MSVISLSRLQALRDVNNPAASPMEAALLHALDWRPAAQPDSVFDAADRAASEPLYGPELDAADRPIHQYRRLHSEARFRQQRAAVQDRAGL